MNEIQTILTHLPKLEPCYEKTHNTVPTTSDYDICLAIATGKKYYLWLTFDNKDNVCHYLELNKEKKISNAITHILDSDATTRLHLGTILYGSMVEVGEEAHRVFLAEDIMYDCGINVSKWDFKRKFNRMATAVQTLRQIQMQIPIALAAMWLTTEPARVPGYGVHHLQYRSTGKIMPYVNIIRQPEDNLEELLEGITGEKPIMCDFSREQFKRPTVFIVKPDMQFDIYNLYAYGRHNKHVFCGVAGLQTYKQSVLMNDLFRKMKANANLDAIEESDDEDMFEDTRRSKWVVDMNKEVKMEFLFDHKMKKWLPQGVAPAAAAVVNENALLFIRGKPRA